MVSAQQKLRQAAEIHLQSLFVEGYAGQPQKIILEIVQIPGDGLSIKTGPWIAYFVIQIAARFHLKARQHGHHFAIRFLHLRCDGLSVPIPAQKFEECCVAQVFFQVGALA